MTGTQRAPAHMACMAPTWPDSDASMASATAESTGRPGWLVKAKRTHAPVAASRLCPAFSDRLRQNGQTGATECTGDGSVVVRFERSFGTHVSILCSVARLGRQHSITPPHS